MAPDYHVQFDKCFYSVHPKHIGETVRIRASLFDVIITDEFGNEIARHRRGMLRGQKTTDPEHIPEMHKELLGWSGDRFRSEAGRVGPKTLELIDSVLASRQFEVQTFRVCRGILNLKFKFGRQALERAAAEAVSAEIRSYKGVKILVETIDADNPGSEEAVNMDESSFFVTHDEGVTT